MTGRPAREQADIQDLQKLEDTQRNTVTKADLLNSREHTAYVMHRSGCTLEEIGKVLKVSRQRASDIVRQAEAKLGGDSQ